MGERRLSSLMPKSVTCPTCNAKVSYGTIHEDILEGFPRLERPHPDQRTIGCACCGAFLHAECATLVAWHHLWFSNLRMRGMIKRHGLVGRYCHSNSGQPPRGPRRQGDGPTGLASDGPVGLNR